MVILRLENGLFIHGKSVLANMAEPNCYIIICLYPIRKTVTYSELNFCIHLRNVKIPISKIIKLKKYFNFPGFKTGIEDARWSFLWTNQSSILKRQGIF